MKLNIFASRHSAFYSPLIASISAGFLEKEGIEATYRVLAPGETAAIYVKHAFAACSSASAPLLTVMPVRAGQGVQGSTP